MLRKEESDSAWHSGHFFANRLEIGDGMSIGCDGFFRFSHASQDSAALPVPAIERFRRMRALGAKNRSSGEPQRFLKTGFAFIEAAEIAVSIGESPQVPDRLADSDRLGQTHRKPGPSGDLFLAGKVGPQVVDTGDPH